MEIRIEWSGLSERQLKAIFDHYAIEANPRVARKIVNRIIDSVSVLEHNPFIGQKEELLIDYPEDFRCLVENNYKIIYWQQEALITIASVFDCRQNPEKMRNI